MGMRQACVDSPILITAEPIHGEKKDVYKRQVLDACAKLLLEKEKISHLSLFLRDILVLSLIHI